MAHYSVVVAVLNRRLVARATRDFLHAVPAAALVVADGDEVLWFCESDELRLAFEESPFQSEIREITIPRGRSSPPETVAARAGRHRDVFRYAICAEPGAERPAEGVAHIIVEAGSAAGVELRRPQESIFDTREGEFLDRAQGEVAMSKHKLKLKKGTGIKIDCDYEKDASGVDAVGAYPYLVVKRSDSLEFEAPSDAALVVAFGEDGSPFADGTMLLQMGKGTKSGPKPIRDPGEKKFFPYKYTAVVLKDLDANVYIDDPHVIIDNES